MEQNSYLYPIEIATEFMRQAPVDVYSLAKELGLNVVARPLPNDISGSIKCSRSGSCEIEVNAGHSATRQRFTVAHEIAHYILHRDIIGDGITDNALYRSAQPSAIERQANQFAARLLMPANLVREKFKGGFESPDDMARAFRVSPAVAEIRLKELGLAGL